MTSIKDLYPPKCQCNVRFRYESEKKSGVCDRCKRVINKEIEKEDGLKK